MILVKIMYKVLSQPHFAKNSFYHERNERLRILAAPLQVTRMAVRVVLSVEASHDQHINSVKDQETVSLFCLL